MGTFLQWTVAAFSTLSAVLWFWSATIGPKGVAQPPNPSGDGNLLFQVGDGEYIYWNISKQGRVNAAAAICTGLSAIAGAMFLLV